MPATTRLLVAALLLTGCLGLTSEPLDAATVAGPLGAVRIEEAEIVEQNETAISFAWEGVAPRAVDGLRVSASPSKAVELPPAQHVRVSATLEWEGDADLDLYVADASGAIACAATSDGAGPESCRAFVWQPMEAPAEWAVYALPFRALQETPYRVTLTVESAVPPDVGFDLSMLTRPVHEALPKSVSYAASSLDGAKLYAETFLPDGPGPWPTIFVLSPYYEHGLAALGMGVDVEGGIRNYYVPRGYAVVVADVRGTGNSEGCYEMMGDAERQDAHDLVEWIAAQEWSDGKVGMWGVSYVGTTPHMAAVMAPPHLETIVTVAGVTSQWRNMYLNGVPIEHRSYPTGYWTGQGLPPPSDVERGPAWVANAAQGPCTDMGGPAHVAPGTYEKGIYDAYWDERNQTTLVENVQVPVFYAQGFRDRLVTPEEALDWFNELPSPKKGHFHQGTHQLPPRSDYRVAVHAWFDRFLKDIDNGIDRSSVVEVQLNDDTIRFGDAWPPTDAVPLRLHLTADGALAREAPAEGEAAYLADNGRSGDAALTDLLPMGTLTQAAGLPTRLVFESEPLDAPLHVAGVPWANLVASSSASNTYFLLSLYDVDGDEWTEVAEGWMNAHLRDGFDRSAPLTPGETYAFGFKFMPREYVFAEGHRIGVRILGHDARVDPVDQPLAENTVRFGPEGSWIELPYLAAPDVRARPTDL